MWKSNPQRPSILLNTLTSKLLSDPRIVAEFAAKPRLAGFVRNFFSQENFSRLNKYVLLDSNMRREIMKVFTAGNDHIAEMFLTADDADALAFHDDTSKATMPDDELILTYEELVKLLVAYGKFKYEAAQMQHLMAKGAGTAPWPEASRILPSAGIRDGLRHHSSAKVPVLFHEDVLVGARRRHGQSRVRIVLRADVATMNRQSCWARGESVSKTAGSI